MMLGCEGQSSTTTTEVLNIVDNQTKGHNHNSEKREKNNKMVVEMIPHPYPCKSCVYLPLGRRGSSETRCLGHRQ
jgi:hypothetical protein